MHGLPSWSLDTANVDALTADTVEAANLPTITNPAADAKLAGLSQELICAGKGDVIG